MNNREKVSPWLIRRGFRSLMFTMIAGGVVAMLGSLIDSVFVGNYFGTTYMAAFGYAMPIFIIISAIAGLFSEGGKILASAFIGEGKPADVRSSFTLVCICALLCSVVITVLCLAVPEQIAVLIGAEGEIVPLAADYIQGIGVGVVPIIMMQILSAYIGLDNGEKLAFLGIVAMTVVNVICDWLVVTVLPWGLFGIGLATTLSYCAALLVELCYFLRRERLLRLARPSKVARSLKRIVTTGMPSMISRAASSVCSIFLNNILFAVAGSAAVSALSVQTTVGFFLLTVLMGEVSTLSVFGGMFYGEKNATSLKHSFLVGNRYGLIIAVVLGVCLFFGAPFVAGSMLSAEAEILRMAAGGLRYLAISLPFTAIVMSLMYFYLATERYGLSYTICILRNAFRVIAAWLLTHFWEAGGVLSAVIFGEILLAPIIAAVLVRCKGRGFVFACMALKKDFGQDESLVYECSMPATKTALASTIAEIKEFCIDHGVRPLQAMRIYLSVEEMGSNVIEHAYNGKESCLIDIRIVINGEKISLSIRDNGKKFNPLSYQHSDEQYGIRLIRGLCPHIQYHYIAGINHLTIIT